MESNIETNIEKTNELNVLNRNEETNDDQNDDNNEDNNEENDGNQDIFSLLYGNEEDRDCDSEEDNEVNDDGINGSINDIKPQISSNVVNESQSQKRTDSLKRRSNERDVNQNKRIKAEPIDKPIATSHRLTTTCEAIAVEDQISCEIPKKSSEFMSFLLDLNANDLENKEINDLSMFSKLINISNILQFEDFDSFRETFIPYIIIDLWLKIKGQFIHKRNYNSNVKELKHFYSIVAKDKSIKVKNGLEIRCISVLKPEESQVFKFGHLATIQTAVQPKPNSSTHTISHRKYFGYVISHSIREFNDQNQTEVNHLRLINEYKRDSFLIEEIIFITKFSEELYLRNDSIIVAEPILSVHNYNLQTRAVFKIKDFPIWRQIFNPIYNSKASGVLMNTPNKRFDENQKECIQIALDVVANPSIANSCLLAINGSNGSGKTSLLIEIIKQIVSCKELNKKKVLFTSSDVNCLRSVDQKLRSNRINTYLIDDNINKNWKMSALKHIEHRLTKEINNDKKKLYQQCKEYFESDMSIDLSVECTLFKNSIYEQLKHDLMSTCAVIIGPIDDLCNDTAFYKFFSYNESFNCCIVDDSSPISEPQLYSLLWFGINKFILSADYYESNSVQNHIFSSFGLSRSLFNRYYSLSLKNNDNNQSTIFDI